MNLIAKRIGLTFVFAAMLLVCQLGYAQAEAPLSPEPGDNPAPEKTLSSSSEPVLVESAATQEPASTIDTFRSESTPRGTFDERRIEQRVDGTATQEIIRVTPRPKKNVYRIDNKPNRPKVTPIAVIKGPVAPWGYATRYLGGQVDRPTGKDLQGTAGQPGRPGSQANSALSGQPRSRGSGGGGSGRRRNEED